MLEEPSPPFLPLWPSAPSPMIDRRDRDNSSSRLFAARSSSDAATCLCDYRERVGNLLATDFDQEDRGCPFHHSISQVVPFLIFLASWLKKDKIRQASGGAATGLIQRKRETRKWKWDRSLDLEYSNSSNQAMLSPIPYTVWDDPALTSHFAVDGRDVMYSNLAILPRDPDSVNQLSAESPIARCSTLKALFFAFALKC